jgi:hypothetical protein
MQASRVSSHTTTQAVEAGRLGLNIDTCLQEKNISGTCASCFSTTGSDFEALGALFWPFYSLVILRTLALIRVSITRSLIRSLIHSRGVAWLGYLDGRRSVCHCSARLDRCVFACGFGSKRYPMYDRQVLYER